MKRGILLNLFVFWVVLLMGQKEVTLSLEPYKIYTDLQVALQQPDSVYRLNLSKHKLKKVPPEVFLLKNLKELNLSRNRLQEIPSGIEHLTELISLNLSRNYLPTLPPEIGALHHLVFLDVSQNYINTLPAEMGKLVSLTEMLLWQNDIDVFPDAIAALKKLEKLDMRQIYMNDKRKAGIVKLLPHTEIFFSHSCNCNTPR